jgi:hypothetical protein
VSEPVIHSHWHQSVAGLAIVPSEFYAAVGQAIASRNIPGVRITAKYFSEGAIGSAQRLYLRAQRNEYYFDICGAPFANGSFVSWWLAEDAGCLRGCLLGIPFLGWLLLVLFFRETYYKVDTRLMFQDAIHSAVLEVVDNLTKTNGIRALSEAERKPTMEKLLK